MGGRVVDEKGVEVAVAVQIVQGKPMTGEEPKLWPPLVKWPVPPLNQTALGA